MDIGNKTNYHISRINIILSIKNLLFDKIYLDNFEEKMEENKKLKENCVFDGINLSNTKNTVNIVKNWYSSVYFWNIAYNQANLLALQNNDLQPKYEARHRTSTPVGVNLNETYYLDQPLQQQQPNVTGK
jgi:hypothetical protein